MRRTRRWDGLVLAALFLAGLGLVFQSAMLVSFSAIPVAFVAYGAIAREPSLSVRVERSVSPERPVPGEEVTVELTVTNTGERTISDLRVIDGVPPGLGVADGWPRSGMLVRPGDSETLRYAVTARRGEYAFEPARLIAYTASGTVARREQRDPGTVVDCRRPVEEAPLGEQTSLLVGPEPTDGGGGGVEFHSLREYRPSDARSRIDWRRFAKSGELSTVEFRQDRAASVALLVDVRPAAFRCADPAAPHAVEYSAYAAELCYNALRGGSHRVGVGLYPSDVTAVEVGAGRAHESEVRSLFAEHDAFQVAPSELDGHDERTPSSPWSPTRIPSLPTLETDPSPDETDAVETLLAELPAHAQCFTFSPLLDDEFPDVVDALSAYGNETIVVCPDVTDGGAVGTRLVSHHRQIRIRALRERDVTVVDWRPDEPLSTALRGVV